MCGIVAILRKKDHQVSEKDVKSMLNIIRHRGPDDIGAIAKDGVGIGMVRLSILDLQSPGLCPFVQKNPQTGEPEVALAYNGEIFNYIEVRNELKKLGHRFETTGDTEVLLKAYLEWGTSCLDKFNGMFAFVIADYKNDMLFAARDIAGEKPLYYYESDQEIIFASEIKAILARIGVPEMHTTDEFRAFEYMTGTETLFKGIHAFLPSQRMVARGINGNFRIYRLDEFWDVSFQLMDVNPENALDTFDELMHDAVKIRLRSDVPLGLYLSGGVDSSLIAYHAKPQVAFSIHYGEGEKYDEVQYAKLVAKDIGCEHILVKPDKKHFESYLDHVIYHLDMPVGSFSCFPLYMLAREATKHVRIVLSGEGADELFSGYTRYLLPVHDEAALQIPELKQYHPLVDYYYGKKMDRFAHLLNRGLVSDEVVKSIIAPHFNRFADLRHAMGYTEFKLMLKTLLHMEDRMSSAFGIENRSPFLDKRLISFAYSIPGDFKIRNNTTKWIVKEVAKRYIPKAISDRKEKFGLIAPINRWMNFGGRRGEFDRTAFNELCLERWRKVFYQDRWFEKTRTIPKPAPTKRSSLPANQPGQEKRKARLKA